MTLAMTCAASLHAEPSTTVYGLDFSKAYPANPDNPKDRSLISADMVRVLDHAQEYTYRHTGEEELKLWLYPPTTPPTPGDEPTPAIVFIHGGGWGGGHASYFSPQAIYFAQRGVTALTINYRLTGSLSDNVNAKIKKKKPTYAEDCVRDSKTALRWLRHHAAQFNIDPDRIAVAGGSAGAHIIAAMATMPRFNNPGDNLKTSARPNAMILYNPAFDWVDSTPGRKKGLAQSKRLGLPIEQVSPPHLVDGATPPALLLSGELDNWSPPDILHSFMDRMKTHGRPVTFVEYLGAHHGFFNYWPSQNPFFASTTEQLDRYLIGLGYLQGEPNVRELMPWYQEEPGIRVHKNH
ncbi:MAG: alpha/beta hydrolase [Planctomycetota bacterium]